MWTENDASHIWHTFLSTWQISFLCIEGTMTQTLQIPWHQQKKVWLKPYLPDQSLRHCFVTAISYQKSHIYQLILRFKISQYNRYVEREKYIFTDIAFELLSCRNVLKVKIFSTLTICRGLLQLILISAPVSILTKKCDAFIRSVTIILLSNLTNRANSTSLAFPLAWLSLGMQFTA